MAIRLKDFMNIQTGFFVFIVVVIIVVGMSMSSENNYLNPSGNRNPANQKLMVVDQDSGEISFIQKSLQGVNAQIVADDSVISDAVAKLRTDLDKWNGDRSGEIQTLQNQMKTILGNNYSGNASGLTSDLANLTKHDGNDGILGKLRKRVEDIDAHYDELAGITLYHGNRIYIHVRKDDKSYYLIDNGCDNNYGNNDMAAWCEDKAFNQSYIEKVDQGRRAAGSHERKDF